MASADAIKRLRKELTNLKRKPVEFITAQPEPENILNWHFVVEGPPETPYVGGYYHGILVFPKEYPFKVAILGCKFFVSRKASRDCWSFLCKFTIDSIQITTVYSKIVSVSPLHLPVS